MEFFVHFVNQSSFIADLWAFRDDEVVFPGSSLGLLDRELVGSCIRLRATVCVHRGSVRRPIRCRRWSVTPRRQRSMRKPLPARSVVRPVAASGFAIKGAFHTFLECCAGRGHAMNGGRPMSCQLQIRCRAESSIASFRLRLLPASVRLHERPVHPRNQAG